MREKVESLSGNEDKEVKESPREGTSSILSSFLIKALLLKSAFDSGRIILVKKRFLLKKDKASIMKGRSFFLLFSLLIKELLWQSLSLQCQRVHTHLHSRLGTFLTSANIPPDVRLDQPVAVFFDCDGVLVETEELHRLAYNKAFEFYQVKIGGKNSQAILWDTEVCKSFLCNFRNSFLKYS